eukprot:CAMPEP_0194375406 /NCGR_PEP_ID=MMETSP0174-20130528/23920_1 /TAXON_ID=216777 /ORGANISM="Proboscia alata, Strain PI-D3" /LENGTH=329 /DNA_ID=CAMNT_0039155581 /DNA_START=16 /DNA_END=1005 /DNA_ORIENTATION=-
MERDDTTPIDASLYQCSKCNEMLGRHRFPKRTFRKIMIDQNWKADSSSPQGLVCHVCRKTDTAKRHKQPLPRNMVDGRISDSGVKRRPNNFGYCNYVDKLFSMDCFALDIAPLQVFKSAKDVSESMAAIQAVMRHGTVLDKSSQDRTLCLCIGDGCTPRTSVLVSFLTNQNWMCVSIDPAISNEWVGEGAKAKVVRGLYSYQGTLIDFILDEHRPPKDDCNGLTFQHLVLICVHSHARFIDEASVDHIRSMYSCPDGKTATIPTTIVSLPCCPTFRHVRDIGVPPHIKYDDDCVFSACRSVEIWNFDGDEIKSGTLKTGLCVPIQFPSE